jgi:hypothetical protein
MGKYAYPVQHWGHNWGTQTRKQAKTHFGYRADGRCPLIGYPNSGTHNAANGGKGTEWTSKNGIDFRGDPYKSKTMKGNVAPPCTYVIAVYSGTIKSTKKSIYDGGNNGYQLYLSASDGTEWFYTHIVLAGGIKKGSRVWKGQKIGYVFNYTSNTPHLHLAKKGNDPNTTFLVFS